MVCVLFETLARHLKEGTKCPPLADAARLLGDGSRLESVREPIFAGDNDGVRRIAESSAV